LLWIPFQNQTPILGEADKVAARIRVANWRVERAAVQNQPGTGLRAKVLDRISRLFHMSSISNSVVVGHYMEVSAHVKPEL
jgi:hypothetical protein